jgi:hypothetical protein
MIMVWYGANKMNSRTHSIHVIESMSCSSIGSASGVLMSNRPDGEAAVEGAAWTTPGVLISNRLDTEPAAVPTRTPTWTTPGVLVSNRPDEEAAVKGPAWARSLWKGSYPMYSEWTTPRGIYTHTSSLGIFSSNVVAQLERKMSHFDFSAVVESK